MTDESQDIALTEARPIPFTDVIHQTLTLLPAAVGEHGRGRFFQYSLSAEQSQRLRELADALDELTRDDAPWLQEIATDFEDGECGTGHGDLRAIRARALADKLARLTE